MQRIAVVGGGLIGLACAWRLAQAGCRVQLFDAAPEAREASWAAAGMLAPHHEAEQPDALWRLGAASLERWPAFLRDLDCPAAAVDWQDGGGFVLCRNDTTRDTQGRRLRGLGLEPRWQNSIPGLDGGGWWLPGAQIDPRRLLGVLRGACRNSGVELRYGEAVTALASGYLLSAAGRRHACDEVLLASGAWTPRLAALAGIDLPGSPVKGQLLRLDARLPLPGFVREGHHYLVARSDSGVIVGATMVESGFDRALDPTVTSELTEWATAVAPSLRHAPVCEQWTGLRPRLASGLPVLGRVREGLSLATGHFRNGVLLTPITAELLTAALTSKRALSLPFDAFRPVG